MSDEKKIITKDEAVSRLQDGEYIHTFVNPGGMLIGADWPRSKVLEAFSEFQIEETGETAQRMNHGLAFNDGKRYVFVETKKNP